MIRRTDITLICLLLGLLLGPGGGCSKGVREPAPPVAIPAAFSREGTAPVAAQWWRAFGDEQLDRLIEQALTGNFTLQAAWDRLAQVQALERQASASLWPRVDAEARGSRTRSDFNDEVSYSSLYAAGVAASYEVDLWSGLRSSQAAARLDTQAQRDAVDIAAITLSATLANTWYQLAEAKELVRITQEQIQTNEQVLEVVVVQFRKGKAAAADVLRQRQLVASTEALLLTAEEAVELLQYALSVLIGDRPALAWEQSVVALPDLPPAPALGLPAEVLWRRPDVRLAYRQVQAADQRLAAAIAEQYPRLSLSASVETSSASVSDLFDDWLANLAANAVQPLFDAHRRRAEVQRREAVVSEAIHAWGQTILEALQDVEAALTQERQQSQLLENLGAQLQLARATYERNRERFIKAQADYIRVLESLQSLQTLERTLVAAQRRLVERRVDLYRAIAGGWALPEPALARMTDSKESPTVVREPAGQNEQQ